MNKFIPDPTFKAKLLAQPAFRESIGDAAEKIADTARSLARERAYETGEYSESISAAMLPGIGENVARVNADAPHSAYIEFGTVNIPPEAVLRRAASAVVGSNRLRGE